MKGNPFLFMQSDMMFSVQFQLQELTLLNIGFKVLQGPHVGEVYRTQMSRGLSWYSLRSAYCKGRKLSVSFQMRIFTIWGQSMEKYLSLVFCVRNVKAHLNIFICNILLLLFLNRLQFN